MYCKAKKAQAFKVQVFAFYLIVLLLISHVLWHPTFFYFFLMMKRCLSSLHLFEVYLPLELSHFTLPLCLFQNCLTDMKGIFIRRRSRE